MCNVSSFLELDSFDWTPPFLKQLIFSSIHFSLTLAINEHCCEQVY